MTPAKTDQAVSIRDKRTRNYFTIDNALLDGYPNISYFAILAYIALARYANNDTQKCFISIATLCKTVRVSRASAFRGIGELERSGLILIDRRERQTSEYTLLSIPLESSVLAVSVADQPVSITDQPVSVAASNNTVLTKLNTSSLFSEEMKPLGKTPEDAVRDVFGYYREKIGKSSAYSLTEKRLKMGVKRYQDAWKKLNGTPNMTRTVALMLCAIDALAESEFHMAQGKHAGGTQYNDWENLFRSPEQFEKWLETA